MKHLALIFAAALSSPVFAKTCGTIETLNGQLEILSGGRRPGKAHDHIACGERLVTPANGSAIIGVNGGKMVLGPNSLVTFTGPPANAIDADTQSIAYDPGHVYDLRALDVMYGSIRVSSLAELEYKTPFGEFKASPGSDFFLTHSGNPKTTRAVTLNGKVAYKPNNEAAPFEDLSTGKEVSIAGGNSETGELPIASQPVPLSKPFRLEIRNFSIIAKREGPFTQASAVSYLGRPESWGKSEEQEQREEARRQARKQAEEEKARRHKALEGSYFQHQADAYKWDVNYTPEIGFYTYSVSGVSASIMDLSFAVMPEFGIDEKYSVGLRLGYDNESISASGSSTSANQSGLESPSLFFNGRALLGKDALFKYGFAFTMAISTESVTAGGSTATLNEGMALTPFLGLESAMGTGRLGGRVSYDILRSGRSETIDGYTFSIKGGQALTAILFYEHTIDRDELWGVDVGMQRYAANTISISASGLSAAEQSYISGSLSTTSTSIPQLEAYWSIAPSDRFRYTPTVGYGGKAAYGAAVKGFYVLVPMRMTY